MNYIGAFHLVLRMEKWDMYEPLKTDWKLFQDKVKDWQEVYMARLNQEYIGLLSGEGNASDKFWKLDERIREDQKRPGVMLRLSKSNMFWDIIRLMKDDVISIDDLSWDITKDGTPHRLGEYYIYASPLSIYGNDTPTICIRSSVTPEYGS